MLREPERKRYDGFEGRMRFAAAVLLLAFSVLGVRLWQLQIVHGHEYAQQAEENQHHLQPLKSRRGIIYGRDGTTVLADNRPACDLVFIPAECEDPEAVCRRLESLIGINGDELLAKVHANKKQPYTQILVEKDVTQATLTRVDEHSFELHGVIPMVTSQRSYPQGKTAGQILGYLNEIGPEELEAKKPEYQMGDVIGRAGVEQSYESLLRGEDGILLVTAYAYGTPQLRTDAYGKPYIEKDSYGRSIEESYRRDPVPGGELHLTLDVGLQLAAETLLDGKEGAIAVLRADTGEVLALASSPGYDPNIFVTRERSNERGAALQGKLKPMRNRCFQETYAPGSVFKVLLAVAALEEGVIDEHTSFYCPGFFQLEGGGRKWHCWKRSGHGSVSVVDALAFSCDVFFYNVGLKLGVDKIHEWAQRLGLGTYTGIDLPSEETGLVPSREWKESLGGEPWDRKWYPGNTVNLAIGQGAAAVTPLQCAVMMAAVVNGGYRVQPHLNQEFKPELSERFISDKTLDIVRRGMAKCVEKGPPAPSGTGHVVYIPGMKILGKTGSAQIVGLEFHEKYATEQDIPYELRDHAWFVAGVLDREPPIAMCVLVEHGHHGSSAAAPLAREIIETFYGDQVQPLAIARQEESD